MTESQTHTDEQARRLLEGIRALVRRFSLAERADISYCGMTAAQAATLEALAEGDLRLSDLGQRLGITASTLTCGGNAAQVTTGLGYAQADLELLPAGANLGLGCGAPLEHLELRHQPRARQTRRTTHIT